MHGVCYDFSASCAVYSYMLTAILVLSDDLKKKIVVVVVVAAETRLFVN